MLNIDLTKMIEVFGEDEVEDEVDEQCAYAQKSGKRESRRCLNPPSNGEVTELEYYLEA